jgi:sulfotransferase family protein
MSHERRDAPARIVFITGMGRSGSTILELLLGRIDGWVAGGELRRYWYGQSFEDWLCGCGRLLAECEFWDRVRAGIAERGIDPGDYPGFLDLQRSHLMLRPAPLARLVAGARRSARPESPLHGYQCATSALYAAVADAGEAQVVVDSSKRPPDAYLASWSPDVDLRAVHLVRDPRGVAHSISRQVANPQPNSEYMFRSNPLATGIRWDVRQGLCEGLLRRRLGDRYMRVRYEDVVGDPAGAVRAIARFAGVPDPNLGFLDGHRVEFEPSHTVSGNPFRLRRGQTTIEIKPDEAWRTGMSARDKALATAPTLPLLRHYGYPVRSG